MRKIERSGEREEEMMPWPGWVRIKRWGGKDKGEVRGGKKGEGKSKGI